MYEQCSLTELSNATGISKGVLSRYMNGKEVPNPMHVAKIANELAVSFDDLVDLGDCFDWYLKHKKDEVIKHENGYAYLEAFVY